MTVPELNSPNPRAPENGRRKARGWLAPGIVFLAGLAVTLATIGGIRYAGRQHDQREFERECDDLWQRFEERLAQFDRAVQATRDLWTPEVTASPEAFAAAWQGWLRTMPPTGMPFPGAYEVGYAALVPAGEVALAPFANRLAVSPDAKVIVWQRRLRGPRQLLGDNLYAGPQASVIRQAWQEGATRATGRIELPRRANGASQGGLRLFLPVYDKKYAATAPKPRGVFFVGLILDTFGVYHFGDRARLVEFDVYAGEQAVPEALLSEPEVRANEEVERLVTPAAAEALRHRLQPELFGTRWTIDFRSTVLFPRSTSDRMLLGMGGAGFLLSLVMGALVRLEVVRRLEAEAAAAALAVSERKIRREAEERERLVRDLHERTIQSLLAVNAQLVKCAEAATVPAVDGLRDDLDVAAADLEAAVDEVRDGILRLGPATEADVPFHTAMAAWLARLNRGHGARIALECEPRLGELLTPRARLELSAIIREAVSNALRHGDAARVVVNLRVEDEDQCVLAVHDDGSGFDPAAATDGHGLGHLRQRAGDLKGECNVDSRPGGPTTVRVWFPLSHRRVPVIPAPPCVST